MKKTATLSLAILVTLTFWQSRALATQALTDIGGPPTTATYEQSQHGLDSTSAPNADAGIGEEFTLRSGDTSMELTDVIVKSSGGQNSPGSSGSIDWTLNLYDITDENDPMGTHELTESFPGVSVTNGDYLDFTLSAVDSAKAILIGGDTYAFTVTTSTSYVLGGLLKSNETPPSYLPTGLSLDELVTGNGSGSSLSIYGAPDAEADLTFFLETEDIPEPQVFALLPLGALILWGLRRSSKAATWVS